MDAFIKEIKETVNCVAFEHRKAPYIACCYRTVNFWQHKSFAFIKNSGSQHFGGCLGNAVLKILVFGFHCHYRRKQQLLW